MDDDTFYDPEEGTPEPTLAIQTQLNGRLPRSVENKIVEIAEEQVYAHTNIRSESGYFGIQIYRDTLDWRYLRQIMGLLEPYTRQDPTVWAFGPDK